MISRIDENGDVNIFDFVVDLEALKVTIATKFKEVVGNCYWNLQAGVEEERVFTDQKSSEDYLRYTATSILMSIESVIAIESLDVSISNRNATITATLSTTYGDVEIVTSTTS